MGGYICFILQGQYGLGKHQDTILPPDMVEFNKLAFVQSLVSAMGALGFLKLSIALSLLRLSKYRWYSRTLWMLFGKRLISFTLS
jgi:hypothetical protein